MSCHPTRTLVTIALALALLPAPAARPATPARPADAFVDSVGVNVHAYHPDSLYPANWQAVIDAVGDIGFRYVRDVPYRPDRLNALSAQTGAKVVSIVHYPLPHNKLDLDRLPEMMELSKSLTGLAYLEGPNEYDGAERADPDWPTTLRHWMTGMHAIAKADPVLAAKPIIAPSLGDPRPILAVAPLIDVGNYHSYPGYQNQSLRFYFDEIAARALVGPTKPVFITEVGYYTAINIPGPA